MSESKDLQSNDNDTQQPAIKKVKGVDYQAYPDTIPTTQSITDRILHTFGYILWISMPIGLMLGGPILTMYTLIFIPILRLPILAYCAWIYYDQDGPIKGRENTWARRNIRFNRIWDLYRGYFSSQLIKTAELDASRKYILGYHPHGL